MTEQYDGRNFTINTTEEYDEENFADAKEELENSTIFQKLDSSTKTGILELCRLILCTDGRGSPQDIRDGLSESFPNMILTNIALSKTVEINDKSAGFPSYEGDPGPKFIKLVEK